MLFEAFDPKGFQPEDFKGRFATLTDEMNGGVLIPGVVLLAFGLMLIQQATGLTRRRDAGALLIQLGTGVSGLD